MVHHKESDLQIRCVKWFRIQYPAFARLLEHPKNEGSGDRVRGSIAKAEGVQAGVADLILHVPSKSLFYHGVMQEELITYHSLAIEMKTRTGRQSEEQKLFQRFIEAAGSQYELIRSFEDFQRVVNYYMNGVPYEVKQAIEELYRQVEHEQTEAAKARLQKLINKK